MTRSNIARIIDAELPWAMWEYYVEYSWYVRINERNGDLMAEGRREFDLSLPRGLRLVHSFVRFDGDIHNGGIAQYFGNHSPDEVSEDVDALRTIGAEGATILEEAVAIYKQIYGWPLNHKGDFEVEPWEHPALERLNHLYDAELTRRDCARLNAYLRQHLDECILPVEVECSNMHEFLRPEEDH